MCLQMKKRKKKWKINFILPSLYHSSIRRILLQHRMSFIFLTKIVGDILRGKEQGECCSNKTKNNPL